MTALRNSPATTKAKAKFVLATDGETLEAEDLQTGETLACAYANFPNHFGFFLQLAGISTVKQIRDSAFDIRATSRLNRLYVQLIKDNPSWGKDTSLGGYFSLCEWWSFFWFGRSAKIQQNFPFLPSSYRQPRLD